MTEGITVDKVKHQINTEGESSSERVKFSGDSSLFVLECQQTVFQYMLKAEDDPQMQKDIKTILKLIDKFLTRKKKEADNSGK